MNINFGKTYYNKTWRLLVPCLKGHGIDFVKKYNTLSRLAVGIHDNIINNFSLFEDKYIYSLIDKSYNTSGFEDFIDFIKDKDYYVQDYISDIKIVGAKKHMIVLTVPVEYYNAYSMFIKGQYSKMYTENQVSKLFTSPKKIEDKKILLKSGNGLVVFIEKLQKEFNEKIVNNDPYRKGEWELPLKNKEEIFNYNNTQVFTNVKREKEIQIE